MQFKMCGLFLSILFHSRNFFSDHGKLGVTEISENKTMDNEGRVRCLDAHSLAQNICWCYFTLTFMCYVHVFIVSVEIK